MNSWKVIPAVLVIFGAGVLTGGLLVNYVDQEHRHEARQTFDGGNPHPQMNGPGQPHPDEPSRPGTPEMWRKDFLGHLDKVLKLTPEQHATISKILAEGQQRNHDIWRTNAAPLVRQVMIETRQQIIQTLTPQQQNQFEQLMRHAPHGPPHDKTPPPPPPATNNASSPPAGPPGA